MRWIPKRVASLAGICGFSALTLIDPDELASRELAGWVPISRLLVGLEAVFIDLLKRLNPRVEVISSFPKIAERVFAQQQAGAEADTKRLAARLGKLKELKAKLRQ